MKNILKLKAGQTYVCTENNVDEPWWTEGREYKVILDAYDRPTLSDDDGDKWDASTLRDYETQFTLKEEKRMSKTNELITLTRIDETTLYVNINHIAAFYHNDAWEYTIVILSDGTQLDIKDSAESIAKYF